MNIEKYLESLSMELESLKDRVRDFVDNAHWLTDGEWKESVLRSLLRRNIPTTFSIGRGFIVSPERTSTQIDVLIYDLSKPILFKDGDLVFVTPDAVKAVIEVKTKINRSDLPSVIEKICENAALVRNITPSGKFFGLFSYERIESDPEYLLSIIKDKVGGTGSRIINCVASGDSTFVRFWNLDPITDSHILDSWHAYELPKRAPGYFIHNVVESICPESVNEYSTMWYPSAGKESSKVGEATLRDI